MTSERSPLVSNQSNNQRANGSNLDVLTQQVSDFNTTVSTLRKMSERIGTEKDTPSFRHQLQQRREEVKSNAKDLAENLKKSRVERSDKPRYDRLMNQFQVIFNSFKEITADSIQKERLVAARPEPKQIVPEISQQDPEDRKQQQRRFGGANNTNNNSQFQPQNGWGTQQYEQEEEEKKRRIMEQKEQEAANFKMQFESRNVDEQILKQRNEELKQLERELTGLNEMFVDVSNLVVQQGTMITSIEDNTRKTADETKTAVGELKKASEYQRSSRSKLCCILLLAVIILALAGGFVALALALK